jgi:hypothetical protein
MLKAAAHHCSGSPVPKTASLGAHESDAVVHYYWIVVKQLLGKAKQFELRQVLELSVRRWQRRALHAA